MIAISVFASVHLLDRKVVRKIPRSDRLEDIEPVSHETHIYKLLGNHPRIAQFLSGADDFVDIKYYSNGNLIDYLRDHSDSDTSIKVVWADHRRRGQDT